MRVGDPGDRGDAIAELSRHTQIRRPIIADGSHVDLRRQAEIEDLGNDIGCLKIENIFGKCGGQHFAQFANIVSRGAVAILERHQDHAVIGAGGRTIGKREIIGSRRQSDVVDDERALALRNDFANLVFDRLKDLLGRFDPGPGWCADVELNLATIDQWKEVAADQRQHRGSKTQYQNGNGWNRQPAPQKQGEQLGVALAQPLKASLESGMESRSPVCWLR